MYDNTVVESIRRDGVVLLEEFVQRDGKDLKRIQNEVKEIFDRTQESDYKFGKAVRLGGWQQQGKTPGIYEFFSDARQHEIVFEYLKTSFEFNFDIFATHDYRNDKGTETNGFLHFDKLWRFKFFLYLTDVESEECGAFSCVYGSHIRGRHMRRVAWQELQNRYENYNLIKNKIDVDYPEEKYQITPILAPAGSLIIFDTDCFHKGGNVSQGKERVIIRSHSKISGDV